MTLATTLLSAITSLSASIAVIRLKNSAASLGFSPLGILNSITAHRLCSGGIILFLNL